MKYQCVIMRAGTSKGIYLSERDLPRDAVQRDRVILRMFGSPDRRQIDGLGGAEFLTSKVAIIGPPTRPDADVDYTFGQVGITEAKIDYGTCGNISSGVGPYAIEQGLVKATGALTQVRIHNTSTGRLLIAHVPTSRGMPVTAGDFAIDGVPGTGARIAMDYSDTAGSMTGALLPTGRVRDVLEVPGFPDLGRLDVSFVDCSNPAVFLRMEALHLKGDESPLAIDADPALVARIEAIRKAAAHVMGVPWDDRHIRTQAMPMLILVREPMDYTSFTTGSPVRAEDIDFVAKVWVAGTLHKTFGGTTAICTAAAARIPGTVLWDAIAPARRNKSEVVIGHPSGRMVTDCEIDDAGGRFTVRRAVMYRTARRIMEGHVYVDVEVDSPRERAPQAA